MKKLIFDKSKIEEIINLSTGDPVMWEFDELDPGLYAIKITDPEKERSFKKNTHTILYWAIVDEYRNSQSIPVSLIEKCFAEKIQEPTWRQKFYVSDRTAGARIKLDYMCGYNTGFKADPFILEANPESHLMGMAEIYNPYLY